ncbi:pre-mRNA-splicing factor 18-like [Hibiscus syriacus]|uniref:pre-mRNA-splicing factor 18-like n=1 Tax=Hibiscus syriacus TaxID=106335 RepID=UPI0019210215|nr:pre-mRNA-splicing factor 18-like [Hibiscus syriacus]
MDLLKEELLKKRQSLAQDTGGKRVFKRSEIEQKQIQKLREQEKRELEAKSRRQSTASPSSVDATPAKADPSASVTESTTATTTACSSKSLTNEQNIDNLDLPRQEVIRRLRILKQPITLFGEDDATRLDRLKYVLKAGLFEVDRDMTDGQTNDFLRDIAELRKWQKSGISSDRKRKEREEEGGGEDGERGGGEEELSGDSGSNGVDMDKDLKRMKTIFDELCDEDKILVFFKRLLNEWKQELDEMGESEKRTAKGKSMVATFKQCARYLNPLFKFCRKKVLPVDIRQALLVVVECCMKRDYLAAMDHYIKMAIGNAPWPIGVTMVGIHERSAREKIYTNSVAHIMNDETTRKYLQSVKRLMTFCQRRYPTVPSKAVEFNSLANGSDLQSLLAEERDSEFSSSDDKLRLMPAPSDT